MKVSNLIPYGIMASYLSNKLLLNTYVDNSKLKGVNIGV